MKIISGKIPVRVNIFFVVLIAIIGYLNTLSLSGMTIWMAIIIFSVLIHEFGHAITATNFGQKASIELFGFGGITKREGPPLKLWQDFLIVFNGPLFGFLLAFAAYYVRAFIGFEQVGALAYALDITIWVNVFWTIVNLLPIHPLDGGHLLRIILEGIFGFKGIKIALFVSFLLSALVCLFFILSGAFLIGALFFMLTFEGFKNWKNTMNLTKNDQDSSLQNELKRAKENLKRGELEEALQKFLVIYQKSKAGLIFLEAVESIGKILYEMEKYQQAYDILNSSKTKLSPESIKLLHLITFLIGKWKEAISLENLSFQYFPSPETAIISARCHAILGEVTPSIGWLKNAIDQGIENAKELINQKDFDPIRDTSEFQEFIKNF